MFLTSIQTSRCSKVITVSRFVHVPQVTSCICLSLSSYECIFCLPLSALWYASGHAKEALDLARMQEQTSHLEYQSKIKVPEHTMSISCKLPYLNSLFLRALAAPMSQWFIGSSLDACVQQHYFLCFSIRNMKQLLSSWKETKYESRLRRGGKLWMRRPNRIKRWEQICLNTR